MFWMCRRICKKFGKKKFVSWLSAIWSQEADSNKRRQVKLMHTQWRSCCRTLTAKWPTCRKSPTATRCISGTLHSLVNGWLWLIVVFCIFLQTFTIIHRATCANALWSNVFARAQPHLNYLQLVGEYERNSTQSLGSLWFFPVARKLPSYIVWLDHYRHVHSVTVSSHLVAKGSGWWGKWKTEKSLSEWGSECIDEHFLQTSCSQRSCTSMQQC